MFPFDISLVLCRRRLHGKNLFFPLQLKPFLITQCNCTGSYCTKKRTNGSAAACEPMAMQPAIACQDRPALQPHLRFLLISDEDPSSLTLTPGSAVETSQHLDWTSCSIWIGPLAAFELDLLQRPACRLGRLLQMPHRHCKTCRSPLHADDTHAECVSCLGKSHADAVLSGTDCSHCESFNLDSLRSRMAFFSECDSAPRALPISSSQGPVRAENSSGR